MRTDLYTASRRAVRGVAGLLAFGMVVSASVAAFEMGMEHITLRNGVSYSVSVKGGMPEAVRNEHAAFSGLICSAKETNGPCSAGCRKIRLPGFRLH